LREANLIRQEIAKTGPNPLDSLHLMRSYCRLSDAELAMNHIADARGYAASALPILAAFKVTSPSLMVLRDLGFCYESLGNVQRSLAADRSGSLAERRVAQAQAREGIRRALVCGTNGSARSCHPRKRGSAAQNRTAAPNQMIETGEGFRIHNREAPKLLDSSPPMQLSAAKSQLSNGTGLSFSIRVPPNNSYPFTFEDPFKSGLSDISPVGRRFSLTRHKELS